MFHARSNSPLAVEKRFGQPTFRKKFRRVFLGVPSKISQGRGGMGLLRATGAIFPKPETESSNRGLSISIPNNPFLNSLRISPIHTDSFTDTLTVSQ